MNTQTVRWAALAVLAVALGLPTGADEGRWEKTIQGFEARDAESPPPTGEILFIGSSSIVMWKTDEAFKDLSVINRGFGGSQIADSVQYASRIAIPYKPRIVVFYAGDNDIAGGKSPAQVFEDYKKFVSVIHRDLPQTRIVYIAIKPSLARWKLVGKMREANKLIEAHTARHALLDFLDVDGPMLGDDGKPRAELFVRDGLHLSAEGYKLWNELVRPYLGPAPK